MKTEISTLKASSFETPLGLMLAISDEETLYLLEFADRRGVEVEMQRFGTKTKSTVILGITDPIRSIENELSQYFAGALQEFKTPLFPFGSPFQKKVWEELRKIPYGKTISYGEQAAAIQKPTAYRAVALANGANPFSIVVPCHRVINTNGKLGGYGGGLWRKKWLLDHEKKFALNIYQNKI